MTRARVQGYAALVVAFLLGTTAGAAAAYAYLQQDSQKHAAEPAETRGERRMRTLARELSLSPQQQAHISAIWEKHRDERRRLTREVFERCGEPVNAHKAAIDDEIRAALSPEQRLRFDELLRTSPDFRR